LKTSMADPLGGDVRSPEAPTTFLEDVDDAPLGGCAGDLRAPTINAKNIDGGLPKGCYWRNRVCPPLNSKTLMVAP
jgi:hypothetical protein